jgi:hypothetical protein
MNRTAFSATVVTVAQLLSGCGPARTVPRPAVEHLPRTRAERTAYRETSSYADVLAFVDSLHLLGPPLLSGSIGRTVEGRAIPFLVVSRPLMATPQQARTSGRPVVYVQANIHAGEVEGKEALLALVRDLLLESRPNVLDSIVLIAVPLYNADGNERLAPQARNRPAQNGPEMVGTRTNAQGLNLNRDYMKLDAPETRASLAMFSSWDPHVFVDLHTTDGSYHGYNLTYAPSLVPAAELPGLTFGGAWARDSLLPLLRQRLRERHQVATFDYGNFSGRGGVPNEWRSYEHLPRYGTNYYGLRGRIGILSEAYSHDPFERRVRSTYLFVRELLSLIAERSRAITELAGRSDALLSAGQSLPLVPVRATMTNTPYEDDVVYEEVERTGDSVRYEPGLPPGVRRTGRFRTARMKIYDRFVPVVSRPAPWAYALAPDDTSGANLLRMHGVVVERLATAWEGDAGPQFAVDSIVVAATAFEGRREVQLLGRWIEGRRVTLPAGSWIVRVAQPLGVLAMYLLEPESDDGLVAWDVGGRSKWIRELAPVARLARPLPLRLAATP